MKYISYCCCRGGRGAQISRLLALHAYLHGEPSSSSKREPAATASAAAQAAHRKADHDDLAANLAAKQTPSVFDVNKEPSVEEQPAPKRAPPAPEPSIVSKWTTAEYEDDVGNTAEE